MSKPGNHIPEAGIQIGTVGNPNEEKVKIENPGMHPYYPNPELTIR